MSTIQRVRPSSVLDHPSPLGYAGWVDEAFVSKPELAAQAWRPLARFFFDTVRHRQKILSQEGLTPNDVRALIALDRAEGRTMSELAEAWACDASNATFIVDRLEERSLAERRTVPTDRRVKLVVLTERGAEIQGRVLQRFFEPPPELLELTRADLEALREAASRLPSTGRWGGAAGSSGVPTAGSRAEIPDIDARDREAGAQTGARDDGGARA
jgi:DNA-binding MarR family transcriptional regulator